MRVGVSPVRRPPETFIGPVDYEAPKTVEGTRAAILERSPRSFLGVHRF